MSSLAIVIACHASDVTPHTTERTHSDLLAALGLLFSCRKYIPHFSGKIFFSLDADVIIPEDIADLIATYPHDIVCVFPHTPGEAQGPAQTLNRVLTHTNMRTFDRVMCFYASDMCDITGSLELFKQAVTHPYIPITIGNALPHEKRIGHMISDHSWLLPWDAIPPESINVRGSIIDTQTLYKISGFDQSLNFALNPLLPTLIRLIRAGGLQHSLTHTVFHGDVMDTTLSLKYAYSHINGGRTPSTGSYVRDCDINRSLASLFNERN